MPYASPPPFAFAAAAGLSLLLHAAALLMFASAPSAPITAPGARGVEIMLGQFERRTPAAAPAEAPPEPSSAPARTDRPRQSETRPTLSSPAELAAGTGAARASYAALLKSWIARQKFYPARARALGIEGVSHVRFRLNESGRLAEVRLEKSAGSPLLDRAAMTMIRRAQPMPVPPPALHNGALEFTLPIAFSLQQ